MLAPNTVCPGSAGLRPARWAGGIPGATQIRKSILGAEPGTIVSMSRLEIALALVAMSALCQGVSMASSGMPLPSLSRWILVL